MGADDLTACRMYSRYADAIKHLYPKVGGRAQPILDKTTEIILKMEEVVRENSDPAWHGKGLIAQQILNDLRLNGDVLIPAWSSKHAMLAEIEEVRGGYKLRIYNSGAGVADHHDRGGSKFGVYAEYDLSDLTAENLTDLLALRTHPSQGEKLTKPKDIYDWANKVSGGRRVDTPAAEMTWQMPQKSGDCSLEVLNAYLRDRVKREVLKNPDLGGETFARALYREMRASYLDEVRHDYIREHPVIDKYSAIYLEAIKIRADRTRIAAAFKQSGAFRPDSVAKEMKGWLRTYSQVMDLGLARAAGSAAPQKGAIWYRNRKFIVERESSSSDARRSVYREVVGPHGGGVTFEINLVSGLLTIHDPVYRGTSISVEPVFGDNFDIQGINVALTTSSRPDPQASNYLRMSSAEARHSPELARIVNPAEIAKLTSRGDVIYLKVLRSGDHVLHISGYVFDSEKQTASKVEINPSSKQLVMGDPVISDGPVLPTTDSDSEALNLDDEDALGLLAEDDPSQTLASAQKGGAGQIQGARDVIDKEIQSLQQMSAEFPLSEPREIIGDLIHNPDSSTSQTFYRVPEKGAFEATRLTLAADGVTASYVRKTLDAQGVLMQEDGTFQADPGDELDEIYDRIRNSKTGELAEHFDASEWHEREIWPGHAGLGGGYEVTEQQGHGNETDLSHGSSIQTLSAAEAASRLGGQIASELSLSGDEAGRFSLGNSGEPVEVITSTIERFGEDGKKSNVIQTRYLQKQPDGSTRAIERTETQAAGDTSANAGVVEWRSQDTSADGKSLSEVTRTVGSDAHSERTVQGSNKRKIEEVLTEWRGTAASDPDQAVVRTKRTTVLNPDGSQSVSEDVRAADTLANAAPEGLASHTEHSEMAVTFEPGSDGATRRIERSTSRILNNGQLTTGSTEIVKARRGSGEVVERVSAESTTPANITVRRTTQGGQTSEEVKVGSAFVKASQAPDSPSIKAALAMQELAETGLMADLAATQGDEVLAPLLAKPGQSLSADPVERKGQLQGLLKQRAEGAVKRVALTGAAAAGGGALALYQAVLGARALADGLKSGDSYMIAMGGTGLVGGAAQVAELGLHSASLMSSSSKAIAALSKVGSVAGKLGIGLGVVAMGMSIPGLVDAIKRGDTKAIVSSAVGLGGGVAAMVAGAAIGGPLGALAGVIIGGLVIGFVEAWNKLFNAGTRVSGANPLMSMTPEQRQEALKNTQVLFNSWDQLGGDLSKDRLHELSQSGPSEDIKAAAQYFVDHEDLINWMDAANGGGADLEQRDAKYDGKISKSDVARFIGYLAVPPEIYRTLPAPSQDARLWAVGIIDPDTQEQVIDAFGKDGEGQGSGDGTGRLAEYANIASGLFDERTRELLKQRYPDKSDVQIEQDLTLLKKACAYLAAYPSEFRAVESFKKSAEMFKLQAGQRSYSNNEVVWTLADGSALRIDRNRIKNDIARDTFDRLINGQSVSRKELEYLESEHGSEDLFEGDDWDTWMRFTQSGRDDGADEDGALARSDIEAMHTAYETRIKDLLKQYPDGLPSFDDAAEANRALGENNPALWRDSRFGEPNSERLQSYYQVVRQNFPAIDGDSNGELNWAEMANAREQALQDKQYALYYALDHLMRNGADLFEGRGEGHDLHLTRADLALKAGQDTVPELVPAVSVAHRGAEAATLASFIDANPQGERLEVDDLYRLAAGYWQNQDKAEITVPPTVRQAALYFTQHPGELAALISLEAHDEGLTRFINLQTLRAAAQGQGPQTALIAPEPQAPQELSQNQETEAWAYLQQHFDEIEVADAPGAPADGQASVCDIQRAQHKALQDQDWPAYNALSWLMSNITHYADANSRVLKDTVARGYATHLLQGHHDEIDAADGIKDGHLSLDGLGQMQAQWQQQGHESEAQAMAWLIQDFNTRIERLGTSLDVDEGMKRDGKPADNLISIDGDIQKQVNDQALFPQDKAALQSFLNNPGLIPHYGDEDDPLVSTQEFQHLLGQNLQWFEGAPATTQAAAPQPQADEGMDDEGGGWGGSEMM